MSSGLLATLNRGRTILLLFVITQSIYLVMVLVTLPHLQALAAGLDPFDLMLTGYDLAYANNFLAALGPEGRDYYLTRQIPLDLFFPGLFAITYAALWWWLLGKADRGHVALRAIALLPLIVGITDYGENACVIVMLTSYPDLTGQLVAAASAFTITKALATTVYFMALIGLLMAIGVAKLKGGKS